jgi:hypothetical protein
MAAADVPKWGFGQEPMEMFVILPTDLLSSRDIMIFSSMLTFIPTQ